MKKDKKTNKCIWAPKKVWSKTLKSKPIKGKRLLYPFNNYWDKFGFPVRIVEDVKIINDAEVHLTEDDLWFCIEGKVRFTVGGQLVNPRNSIDTNGQQNFDELSAKKIKNGKIIEMRGGDWLYVPAGQPHQHGTKGVARLVIIKIPIKK